jgi:HNH endonuclease
MAKRRAARGEAQQFLKDALDYEGDDCLIWPFATAGNGSAAGGGYGVIGVEGRMAYVHRIICEAVCGPAPSPKHEVAHSCGRGHESCITPKHLRWATRIENHMDRLEHGTLHRGDEHYAARLTEKAVKEIRALRGKATCRELAKRYGVSASTVHLAQIGRNWGWVE